MKIVCHAAVIAAFFASSAVASAHEISTQSYIGDSIRTAPAGVAMRIEVVQGEMTAEVPSTDVNAAAGSFGLLGALVGAAIGAAVDSSHEKKAEALLTPLRNALTGFDVDGLAIDTARSEMTDIGWIAARDAPFSKDGSIAAQSAFLDAGNQPRAAFVSFSYQLSPDFSAIRVTESISIARKLVLGEEGAPVKPTARLSDDKLDFQQTIISEVSLSEGGHDKAANAALWAADGGKRARAALAADFAEVRRLTPHMLTLTADDIKKLEDKSHKKVWAYEYYGRPVDGQPDGISVIWQPGFRSAQLNKPAASPAAAVTAAPAAAVTAAPAASTTPLPAGPAVGAAARTTAG